jgi:hypothetical protein
MIKNDPKKAGEPAQAKQYFGGEGDSLFRFAVFPVHTRFDAVQWFVADADLTDPVTGMAEIIRQEPTKAKAMAGLVEKPILRDRRGRAIVKEAK